MKSGKRFELSARALAVIFVLLSIVISSGAQDRGSRQRPRHQPSQSLTVPEDTVISLRMDSELNSRNSRVGDKFTATVSIPVHVNGAVAIPAGSVVEGHITQVTPAKRMNKSGMIAVEFDRIIMPDGRETRVNGILTSDDPRTRRKIDDENRVEGSGGDRAAIFVGGGGILGAVLGGIAGGGKGAAVGGAVGAGVGLAGILLSKGEEAQVPRGTPIGLQLKDAIVIQGETIPADASGTTDDPQPHPQSDQTATSPARPKLEKPSNDREAEQNLPDKRDKEPKESDNEIHDTRNDSRRVEGDSRKVEEPESKGSVESDRASEKAEANLPLDSPQMIRRAQEALRDEGYYEGPIDGAISPRTQQALKTYQRENKLPETGSLDQATASKLGITGSPRPAAATPKQTPRQTSGDESRLAEVTSASATRLSDGSIQVVINTRANTGGWRWFGDHVVNGDTLEVYARAVPPSGPATQALTKGRIDVRATERVQYVRRVVVHASNGDTTIDLNGRGTQSPAKPASTPTSNTTSSGPAILRQAEDLLARYQQAIGVRLTPSGVEGQLDESETEVLFALDGFVNAARLYSRVAGSSEERERLRSATLSLAREARRADRIITTTSSRAANMLVTKWDPIRQEVLKLMQAYNIKTSDLEN